MISGIFWGSTLLAVLAAMAAILFRNWRYTIPSAVLYLPLVWYLSATPRFAGAFLLYLFHLLIAYSLSGKRNLTWLARVSFVPLLAFPIWIALMAWNQ